MFRRLFLFALTFTYLLTSAGISVAAHFCGKNLQSVSFYSAKAKSCSCKTKSKKKKGCCNSSNTFIKISSAQQVFLSETVAAPKVIQLFLEQDLSLNQGLANAIEHFKSLKAPPASPTPNYIQFRLLRL